MLRFRVNLSAQLQRRLLQPRLVRHSLSKPVPPKPVAPEATAASSTLSDCAQSTLTAPWHTPTPEEKNWVNPSANMKWSDETISQTRHFQPKHKPKTVMDRVIYGAVRGAYHSFNAISGYNKEDPTPEACTFRLIFLESVAGVPGMVGASVRHFKSLRTLRRDYGWIHTLLEEAENERMHLLTVMRMFDAGIGTRVLVGAAQVGLVPILTIGAIIRPHWVHRFVGYIEETAVHTYSDLIAKTETPGTKLHAAWSELKAPEIAITYWRMDPASSWLDVLKQIMADEANHRDVNHTFAAMNANTKNPYIQKHHKAMGQVTEFMKNKDAWMFEKGAIRKGKPKYLKTKMKMEATKEEVLAAYQKLDGMFEISPKILAQHFREQKIEFDSQFLNLLLEFCDTDGDGHVTHEEFLAFLDKYYEMND